jgi:Tat protein secretion system quality control protein TatD with DNase activity
LHPLDADQDFDYDKYKALINNKVVGIGETGLDYCINQKEKQD